MAFVTILLAAGTASAALFALDDFSSDTNNGGTGWPGAWDDPTMSFSTTSPFNDNVSAGYLWDNSDLGATRRTLATPLLPSTTPEVWTGVYLRPTNFSGSWQFGVEVNSNVIEGAQAGSMLGDTVERVRLARANAESPSAYGPAFTLNQPALLAMRIYKNSPTDTVYNRADLYADMDGTDGRYNSPVTIATGLDLGGRSAVNISRVRLLSDINVDFDYIAVGSTEASVTTAVPEPSTLLLAAVGLLGMLAFGRRRK